MSKREIATSLQQMLDHSREAIAFCQGKSRDDLDANRTLNLSVVRLLEVVGEAAMRVPTEYRADHAEIPWRNIIDMRLIHGYDEVDFDIVWEVVVSDLPALIPQLESLVEEETSPKDSV